MPEVRELPPTETALAYEAMLELRSHLPSEPQFVERVNEVQRLEGYRLAASFDEGSATAAAVAGFRLGHNLAWGHYLYVDDLVTKESARNRGHAAALMEWLCAEARRRGCDQLHLDSGTWRHGAHRFYLKQGLHISSFHFDADVSPSTPGSDPDGS